MKKILLFTFLGPPLGVILFFLPILIFTSGTSFSTFQRDLSLFPIFFVAGYVSAIIPAFIVGVIAAFLKFKNPWMNFGILTALSIITCTTYFINLRSHDFMLLSAVGIVSAMILGYIVFLRQLR